MLPTKIRIAPAGKIASLCTAIVLLCLTVSGQEYDSIAIKYKNEHAVITNYTEKLVLSYEDGKLVANSYVTMQKLMISDLAPGMYHNDGFYHSSTFSKLTDYEANVLTPSKTGYKKKTVNAFRDVDAKSGWVFYDDIKYEEVFYSGLVKKSVTELKYSMEHTDIHMLPRFYFQEDLPIVKATFEVVVPKYVNMSFVLKGEHTSWIKQTKNETGTTTTYTFTANDIPAEKAFDDVPSFHYYIPHVIPYITSYKRYGEDKVTDVLANPDQLYKYLYKYISKINMVDDTTINKTVDKLTKNDHTPREKAAHIYKWVQKNMHYIAFEDGLEGFVPREAKVVCDRKYGDCKDMASIIVAMCRRAGIEAHFAWIGTTELPYTHEETPLPSVTNHMICAIKLDGQWVFLDGTDPQLPFGNNREDVQGKEAMIAIDTTNYKIVTLPEVSADKNGLVDSTFLTLTDNTIKGSVKQRYQGYRAWDIAFALRYYKNEDKEKYIKGLTERGSDKYLQTRYDIAASDSGSKDVTINSDFTVDDYVQQVGKQYYVNMNVMRDFQNKRIDTNGRTVGYYYPYKEKKQEVVVLDIPKGYKVSHLPAAAHASIDGLWGYTITYKADKKQVTLIKTYELNALAVNAHQFADNNKMVDGLKKIYKESVVLTTN